MARSKENTNDPVLGAFSFMLVLLGFTAVTVRLLIGTNEENRALPPPDFTSIENLPPGGHMYGWSKTRRLISHAVNATCTTSLPSVAAMYSEVSYTPRENRKKRAIAEDPDRFSRQNRIVGGGKTNIREFPWLVSLQVHSAHVCGGSMILSNWVLTAAHCTDVYRRPRDWTVLAGVSNSHDYSKDSRQAGVTHIYQHRYFDSGTYDNDIALMIIDDHFTFGERLQPVCMPHPDIHQFTTSDVTAQDCYVSGFGTIWAGGPPSGSLLAVNVPQVNNNKCNEWFEEATFGQAPDWVTHRMLCAGYEEGRLDACQGDSGGPLSCIRKTSSIEEHSKETWFLAGAVSWGMDCAKAKQPGVYTRIILYYDWTWKQVDRYITKSQYQHPKFYQVT